MSNVMLYDILIIGAGPAGMSAAIYAGRANKTVLLIDPEFGGNIAKSPKVENIPGFSSISGVDFAAQMYEQATSLPTVEHVMNKAVYIEYYHRIFKVSLDDRTVVCGKSLIFATGTQHKELKLDTPDIYYCATCDGPFFKNESVIVVGSGNTGATYALELAEYCKKVYICDLTLDMQCESILQDRIHKNKKITWLPNTTITKVNNDKQGRLSSVTLSTLTNIKCKGIFAAIGLIPQTQIVNAFAKLDDKKYIVSSNVPGVFAAGDCTNNKVKQVVTATAEGAIAAINAIQFVETLK